MVCLGTTALATLLGLSLALLTVCFRVPMHRWMSTIVLSLILIPIYVQATAWSAGFGVQGWFRLSQVSAALSPSTAIASVVWIHAMAATPVCFLLCALGVRRSFDSNCRQALLDFGRWFATFTVLIPKLWPWIAAGAIWTIAMTGNDMVVTNLFQVPTITETVYQQVQFNELNQFAIGQAVSFAIAIGIAVLVLARRFQSRIGGEKTEPTSSGFQAFELRGGPRWLGAVLGWVIVSMVALIPFVNLIVKAGYLATMDNGEIRRSWSASVLVQSIVQSRTFLNEISWSIQLSLYASALSLVLGVAMVGCAKAPWATWLAIGLMAFLLALPGPIINLLIISLLDRREPAWVGFLADRTLIGPILALQSRCLPIVFGVLWLAKKRFATNNDRLLQLDQGLPYLSRTWILLKAMLNPLVVALVIAFFVSFADLSSYLLVQPPQVTTVAMRMFDLLHYGIKNRESGLALTLVIASAIPTLFFVRRMDW